MDDKSAIAPPTSVQRIQAELTQSHERRVPLLAEIGEYFQCTVVAYYTSHTHWQGSIEDVDAVMLNDMLAAMGKNSNILLIINSPGGNPLAAERIIKTCRTWADKNFYTLVPEKAKSAATIVCFGSDKILMTPVSELGPIDVQIPWGDRLLPAHIVIKSYEDLFDACVNTPLDKRVEPFLQQLQKYDAGQIESLRLARDLSHEIAKKVLDDGMLAGKNKRNLSTLLSHFLDPEKLKVHGRPIFYSDIKKIDKKQLLNIECISTEETIFEKIHEYHQRLIFHMGANNLAKICETTRDSFKAPIIN